MVIARSGALAAATGTLTDAAVRCEPHLKQSERRWVFRALHCMNTGRMA